MLVLRCQVLAAIALLAGCARTPAALASSERSPIGTFATVQRALRVAATLPKSSAGRDAAQRSLDACREQPAARPGCPALDVARCDESLQSLYDALARDAGRDDPVTANLARFAQTVVSDALSRLTWATPRDGADGCTMPFAGGRTAATIQVSGDGRTVRMRPLRPLRAGRTYQLIVAGRQNDQLFDWRAGSGSVVTADRADQLVATFDTVFSDERTLFDKDQARALLRGLADAGGATLDVPATAGVVATLRTPLSGAQLALLRAWFEPATTPAPADSVIHFRTLDPRSGLRAYQSVLARRGCTAGAEEGIALEPVTVGKVGAAVAGVQRGRFHSLEVTGKDATSRLLGVAPSAARPTELSFLLALPKGYSASTPVVLAVHGHGGRAEAMLTAHANELARRGMATLALDLPAHGERASEPPFVNSLEPQRLTPGMRQATVDVLALLHAGTGCGFVLPDGERMQPSSLRYLGYSLGSAIGVMARAVEPQLGTTVLVAPPGDLVDWQVSEIAKRLGAETYTVCSGGPQNGRMCLTPTACGPDGACIADPLILLLDDLLTLPYGTVFGGADPLAFAVERTGATSTAPLLLIAGGLDTAVGPLAGPRLADSYGMTIDGGGGRRGASRRFVYWPTLGHDLFGNQSVRDQAYDFLMSAGRRRSPSAAARSE